MRSILSILVLLAGTPHPPLESVHHDLAVLLRPSAHEIEVTDVMTLPPSLTAGKKEIRFVLDRNLELTCDDAAYALRPLAGEAPGGAPASEAPEVPVRRYALAPVPGTGWPSPPAVRLRYRGAIHHPLHAEEEEAARSFSRSPGLIDERGVVLSGSTQWIPDLGEGLVTFRLTVTLPAAWDAVSQGSRTLHDTRGGQRVVTWDCPDPMDEAYLIAAPFTEYSRRAGSVLAEAFLRTPDAALAGKYLEATAQYLEMYGKLIGPYPYRKFALVENFWETGFGMPSFTLLGPKIIRFPFILHSSYPHEILHNWWGNSVFVDYEKGNWCEGLTAYLADHLIKEGQGKGEEYRRDTLKKYLDYVRAGRDFPLTEFRSRHSAATEAVGYGKTGMLFHMLRRDLGDALFAAGLRRFYARYKFRRATFDDLAAVFSETAGRDVRGFFEQWVTRTGAPEIRLGATRVTREGQGYRARVTVEQVQDDPPFRLRVPVAFTLEGVPETDMRILELAGRSATLEAELSARPLRVELDPQYDLFRRLDRSEIPPSVGQLMGAEAVTVVLPEGDPIPAGAWRDLAAPWYAGGKERVRFVSEGDLETLPGDRAVWILGGRNRHAAAVRAATARYGASASGDVLIFGEVKVSRAGHCFVYTASHPGNPDLALGWIGADLAAALTGLSRKLPHYGKYSYLAFAGEEPANDAKGQWPPVGSPLARDLDAVPAGARARGARVPRAAYPKREPLARLAPVFDPGALLAHVRALTAREMEGRGAGTAGLERAARYIADRFREIGLRPGGGDGGAAGGGAEGSFFQSWVEPGGPQGRDVTLRNVVGILPGTDPGWKGQSVILGAHYDHLGRGWPDVRSGNEGKIHPGADDNASGVAVLLEVAKLLASGAPPRRTLVFVAFSGEEWGLRGSRHYVLAARRYPVSRALAMINLDTVGRLGGDKLTVFGSGSAAEWIHIAMGIGFTTGVESKCIGDDLGSSDQKSFLEAGVPAVQIFSGPNADYHRPSDTPDKIDGDGLVRVASWVREALGYLAEREDPLTFQGKGGGGGGGSPPEARGGAPRPGSGRRVSLGTMPDFQFQGKGVRIASVLEKTPAARAGLRAGDLVIALDGKEIRDLRAYSNALKAHAPGDTIQIRVVRDGSEITVRATLVAR